MRIYSWIFIGFLFCGSLSLSRNSLQIAHNRIENPTALRKFTNALTQRKIRPVTVVHFGDSHVQMGYFSKSLAAGLQNHFGMGNGGDLFPYSACRSFGPKPLGFDTVGAWTCQNLIRRTDSTPLGLTGYRLQTQDSTAYMRFWLRSDSGTMIAGVRKAIVTSQPQVILMPMRNSVHVSEPMLVGDSKEWKVQADSGIFELGWKSSVSTTGNFILDGIRFVKEDSTQGIVWHHYGVVGAQWLNLVRRPTLIESRLRAIDPSLLIFSFGTNEAYDPLWDSAAYRRDLGAFLEQVHALLPAASILITGPPDTRAVRTAPPHTKVVNELLQSISRQHGTAFWDLFHVMGGTGSHTAWRSQGLVNKDGMHFLKEGYRLQGALLSEALLHELE